MLSQSTTELRLHINIRSHFSTGSLCTRMTNTLHGFSHVMYDSKQATQHKHMPGSLIIADHLPCMSHNNCIDVYLTAHASALQNYFTHEMGQAE
jgi:hypothetical protein